MSQGREPDASARLRKAVPALGRRGIELAGSTARLARAEIGMLATICAVAGGIWAFLAIADEVGENETAAFDRAVLLAFRNPNDLSDPIGPAWFEEAVRDVTALGGNIVLAFVTLAVIGFLLLVRKNGAAVLVFVAVLGGSIVGDLLKMLFERPRPDLVPHGAEVYTASFPSNHALLSAVTYLTLGALLARLQLRWPVKLYFLTLSILLTVAIGLSRIYLGVHWPTDVLAGWCIGAAWAMAVWAVALWLQRRGRVEPPEST